jgi:hypothetical protein
MFKISHCLDNRFTVGGKFVRFVHRPRSILHNHFCNEEFRENLKSYIFIHFSVTNLC